MKGKVSGKKLHSYLMLFLFLQVREVALSLFPRMTEMRWQATAIMALQEVITSEESRESLLERVPDL